MLYSAFGESWTQDEIAEATGIRVHIPTRGCRIDQLAAAIQRLTPEFALFGKYDATVEDLQFLTDRLSLPAGVEWRGTFLEPTGHIWHEGHYSIIVRVDADANRVRLLDPFNGNNIAHRDGIIALDDFVGRWWDENYLPYPSAPRASASDPAYWTDHVWTDHLTFTLVPLAESAPLTEISMIPISADLTRQHRKFGRTLDPSLSYRPDASDQEG